MKGVLRKKKNLLQLPQQKLSVKNQRRGRRERKEIKMKEGRRKIRMETRPQGREECLEPNWYFLLTL